MMFVVIGCLRGFNWEVGPRAWRPNSAASSWVHRDGSFAMPLSCPLTGTSPTSLLGHPSPSTLARRFCPSNCSPDCAP
eukprot:5138130-Pyramimonas_sp.AAC.1